MDIMTPVKPRTTTGHSYSITQDQSKAATTQKLGLEFVDWYIKQKPIVGPSLNIEHMVKKDKGTWEVNLTKFMNPNK